MFRNIVHFFDKLEDKVRHGLSRHPIVYAIVSGVAIVLFWRGVWTVADLFYFMSPVVSLTVSVVIMLLTGTFVSFFIGEQLLISGLKEEKRIDQRTEEEIRREETRLGRIITEIEEMRGDVAFIRKQLEKQGKSRKPEEL